jgi:hypothetical protein
MDVMKRVKIQLPEPFRKYHFELRHLLIVFVILVFFQLSISLVYQMSLRNFLRSTQTWYQRDFVDRLANLSATAMELMIVASVQDQNPSEEDREQIVQAFNIILSQQLLQQHVQEVCLLVSEDDQIYAIDDGQVLYSYIVERNPDLLIHQSGHEKAVALYRKHREHIKQSEEIETILEGKQDFHVFVPFVPKGEFFGAFYMRNTPDFELLTGNILTSYYQIGLIFTALIFFGFLALFYISTYTIKERDETQQILFQEREKQLKKSLTDEKEKLFTKRIYHTHHKAEKVMGFIKEDLRQLSKENMEAIKYRMSKYANFISRVIYDMKWYDPPIQTIRGSMFSTNLNDVIKFLVENLFMRTSTRTKELSFNLDLGAVPPVNVNEFVVWEILEPLIQNSIDHNQREGLTISIKTVSDHSSNCIRITITDNGSGISDSLLEVDSEGVRKIFRESISTKREGHSTGYGCYIAYEIATQRCAWMIDAKNLPGGGSQFILTIPLNGKENA